MSNLAPKLLAEFVGTFALIFIGAGAAAVVGVTVSACPVSPRLPSPTALTIMAFAFGLRLRVGRPFQPSVTVGVLAAGAMGVGEAIGYIVSQLHRRRRRRAVAADRSGRCRHRPRPCLHLAHNLALGATTLTVTPAAGFMIEAMLGFFPGHSRPQHRGCRPRRQPCSAAIRQTLTLNILMGGALTGAAFNPARALGPMVATGNFSDAGCTLTAPIVGAICRCHSAYGSRPARP